MILCQRTFDAINQLVENFSDLIWLFTPFSRKDFLVIFFFFFWKRDPGLLLAIKLCPISRWRNKLLRLGHIYLATELYIARELEETI